MAFVGGNSVLKPVATRSQAYTSRVLAVVEGVFYSPGDERRRQLPELWGASSVPGGQLICHDLRILLFGGRAQ